MSAVGNNLAGAPATRHANIKNDAAVRSIAGSTVLNDCWSSLYTAPFPLNFLKVSPPAGGHLRIPSRKPVAAKELGPSTSAPARIGGWPSSEPIMLLT